MQIAEVALFESDDGTGPSVLQPPADVRAIQRPTAEAESPLMQGPEKAIDGHAYTKYLNLGKEFSGVIVSPSFAGSTLVDAFQITTANDFPDRDPVQWQLYGTNENIMSANFSQGEGEPWTLIDSGMMNLPNTRFESGPIVDVSSMGLTFRAYRLVFPTLKNPLAPGVNSLQIAELQLYGDVFIDPVPMVPVPEPPGRLRR
jgi:hypothetical protein